MKIKMKKIAFIVLVMVMLFSVVGCNSSIDNTGETLEESDNSITESTSKLSSTSILSDGDSNFNGIKVDYSKADETCTYDEETSTKINLDDFSVDGKGVSVAVSKVTITQEGTYILTGELQNGQVIIDVDKEKNVQLVLDNVTLNNPIGSAINVVQADKLIITLAENSNNVLSDGSEYANVEDGDPDAVIFSKDDLTLNGYGSLTILANYKDGIKSTDDLIIMSGNITIDAPEEALKGKDSVVIKDGLIDITVNGDGIKATNDEDKGYIVIDGGDITINSDDNGIESEKTIIINGGNFDITAGQDAIHTNGVIQINNGYLTIDAADDAIHADEVIYVEDGSIIIENCYEGLEAVDVIINGGMIDIYAKDDGINAAGGSDGDASPQDHFNEVAGEQIIEINGGYVHIIANGDGLDSNGTILLTAGTIVIDGAVTEMGDPAIDVNAQESFIYKGGTLAAVGCDSMFIVPTIDEQAVVTVMMGDLIEAGNFVSLVNDEGSSIITIKPQHDYETMMFSSEQLEVGKTYSIMVGGSYNGKTIDGTLYTDAVLVGSTKLFDFDINETLMIFDADGNEADVSNYGTQGGGRPGGMPGIGQTGQKERSMNPADILNILPIEDGVLTLIDGTTYEVPIDDVPTLNGETIVFSNGVEVSMSQIVEGMMERGQEPPNR